MKTWKIGGKFHAVHICPKTSADVPDEQTTRLVILSPNCFYGGWQNTDATVVAKNFWSCAGQRRAVEKISVPEGIAKDVQDDIESNYRDVGLTDFRFTR